MQLNNDWLYVIARNECYRLVIAAQLVRFTVLAKKKKTLNLLLIFIFLLNSIRWRQRQNTDGILENIFIYSTLGTHTAFGVIRKNVTQLAKLFSLVYRIDLNHNALNRCDHFPIYIFILSSLNLVNFSNALFGF